MRYRYYTQTRADFHRDQYDFTQPYVTDDDKLSPFDGHTLGVRGTLRFRFLDGTSMKRFADGWGSLLYERILQHNDFGTANVVIATQVTPGNPSLGL